MNSWLPEMQDCMSVDPDNQLEYVHTLQEINIEQGARKEHFLKRHNLWDQFLAEDAQGKR